MIAARTLLLAAALVLAGGSAHAQQTVDDANVRAPLEAYLRGQATGDEAAYRRAFHPDAELFGVRDGQLTHVTADAFITRVSRPEPADPTVPAPAFNGRIESIDADGDIATARIVIDRPNARVVDLMSLIRLDGRWVIVNKTFAIQPAN